MILKVKKPNSSVQYEIDMGIIKLTNPIINRPSKTFLPFITQAENLEFLHHGNGILEILSDVLTIGNNEFETNFENIKLIITKTEMKKTINGLIVNVITGANVQPAFTYDGFKYVIILRNTSFTTNNQTSVISVDKDIIFGNNDGCPVRNATFMLPYYSDAYLYTYVYNNNGTYETYCLLQNPYMLNVQQGYFGTGTGINNCEGYLSAFTFKKSNEIADIDASYMLASGNYWYLKNYSNNQVTKFPDSIPSSGKFSNYGIFVTNSVDGAKLIQTSDTEPEDETKSDTPDDG